MGAPPAAGVPRVVQEAVCVRRKDVNIPTTAEKRRREEKKRGKGKGLGLLLTFFQSRECRRHLASLGPFSFAKTSLCLQLFFFAFFAMKTTSHISFLKGEEKRSA